MRTKDDVFKELDSLTKEMMPGDILLICLPYVVEALFDIRDELDRIFAFYPRRNAR
jgi:hypothetical protein